MAVPRSYPQLHAVVSALKVGQGVVLPLKIAYIRRYYPRYSNHSRVQYRVKTGAAGTCITRIS